MTKADSSPPLLLGMTTKSYYTGLVFWHGRIDFVRPGKDSALQVPNFPEPRFRQKLHGFGRTLAASAVCHYLARTVQFANTFGKFAEGNELAVQVADLIFVCLANIKNVQIVATVEALLQLLRRDFRN